MSKAFFEALKEVQAMKFLKLEFRVPYNKETGFIDKYTACSVDPETIWDCPYIIVDHNMSLLPDDRHKVVYADDLSEFIHSYPGKIVLPDDPNEVIDGKLIEIDTTSIDRYWYESPDEVVNNNPYFHNKE
jgi:hypothetical protein|tara:strand:+ start:1642 stop:2031 length:390 start_codon:yes stop_codon:yes gene_type:complete